MVSLEDIKKLKVAELKDECRKLGLSTDGRKQDLLARLEEALLGGAGQQALAAPPNKEEPSATAAAEMAQTASEAQQQPKSHTAIPMAKPKSVPIPTTVSDEERRKLRAQKFGIAHLPEDEKKKLRADRFSGAAASGAVDGGKPATAAAGTAAKPAATPKSMKPVDPTKVPTLEEIERRKARAIKFGTAPPSVDEEEAAKKLARAKKYGTLDEDTKRKLRAERFKDAIPAAKPVAIPPPAKKVKPMGEVH